MDEPISMYVPARNAEHTLRECVNAIRNQTRPPEELFLVVDMRSTDRTVEVARRCDVTILEQQTGTLGSARNLAITTARHRWLASCNSDVIIDRNWLAALAVRRGQGPVGIGGRTLERTRNPCDAWRALHLPHHWGEFPLRNPFMLASEALFDRHALLAVGGYRDDLNYYADSDLCQRLRDGGYELMYDPAALATHLRTDTLIGLLNLRWKYSEYRQRELLDRFSGLLQKLRINREYALNTLARSLARGKEELAYISLLLFFHHLLMDLLSLLSRRPLLSGAQRGAYGGGLARTAIDTLQRRDEALGTAVRDDLQPIIRLFPAEQQEVEPPAWSAHLAATQTAVREFLRELDDVTLAAIRSSVGHVHGQPYPVQRLTPASPQELQTLLANVPLCTAIDPDFGVTLRRCWPDIGGIRVLGRVTDPDVAALKASLASVPAAADQIAVVPHLEAEPDPLAALGRLDPGCRRMAICYQPPGRYIAGLDVPSPADLASTAAAAGWEIDHFETLLSRTRLFLSRQGQEAARCSPG